MHESPPRPLQHDHDFPAISNPSTTTTTTTTSNTTTAPAYTYHALPPDYRDDPDSQAHSHSHSHSRSSHTGSSSPVAPAYSPITPKVQPVLPACTAPPLVSPEEHHDPHMPRDAPSLLPPAASRIPPANYIPQPPSLPFSSDDAGDAIALRAAISTLQFQKKKAQHDIHTLVTIKQRALDQPETFKDELAAGRLREQRPSLGDLRAILDNIEDDDLDDEVTLGATRDAQSENSLPAETPDSEPSQLAPPKIKAEPEHEVQKHFPRIPGPQTVVRMPHVNWAKYGIAGEPLDALHEQQRRWPGAFGHGDRGREYAIAAPYSPFMDAVEGQQVNDTDVSRKDSGPAPSLTGTISEHIMETRSRN